MNKKYGSTIENKQNHSEAEKIRYNKSYQAVQASQISKSPVKNAEELQDHERRRPLQKTLQK